MKPSSRAALIRKIEKVMDDLEAPGFWTDPNEVFNTFQENKLEGQLEALDWVLWLLIDRKADEDVEQA